MQYFNKFIKNHRFQCAKRYFSFVFPRKIMTGFEGKRMMESIEYFIFRFSLTPKIRKDFPNSVALCVFSV
jgi:hypothetical protein